MTWWRRGRGECNEEQQCSHRQHCSLIHIMTREGMKKWRHGYCDKPDGFKACARFQMSQGGARVPFTLLPDGKKIGE